ncbi:response regulator transcription factor [Cohnella silvisoli]|uniref:Response regulator transcription factor n=1 Tax=Cohnella silvisoli TaxID=2873699 RepID=A0ABV1L441_9BACL|nr:response regulator transcription factor [Cohnella silvisoli]MCD9026343.1 response regulator transcription factor [Cohnella silvisoli]
MKHTILIADDDRDIVRMIEKELKRENFGVLCAYDGKQALEMMESEPVDFLILDVMMPVMDGLEVCRRLGRERNIPVLILSARDREIDRIVGLEIGADDYMTKPFSLNELIARIKAHFRKMSRLEEQLLHKLHAATAINEVITLNEQTYEAFLRGQKLDISFKEFQLLSYFQRNPNRILSREQIYFQVWGNEEGDINTVTVHIKNLRKKFGQDHDFIRTVWGVGYRYTPKADSQ